MVTRVVMPRLSLTMKEGTVVQWFRKEGEHVGKGDPIVEVLSEKVTYDVEAPESGVLRKILAVEGADVQVAGILGIIAESDEPLPEIEEAAVALPPERIEDVTPLPEKEMVKKVGERAIASPAAKRLAREHGIQLAKVKGSGPEGRIVEADVRQYLDEEVAITPRVREIIPLTGIRKTTAERVSLSARTAPHSTVTIEVDISNAVKLREEMQVSYTDILVKAVAKALEEHRLLNSTLEREQIKIYEDINIGVAVATEKGLIVPVIRDANKKIANSSSLNA